MTALDVREQIAEMIKASVPALQGVYFHGGDFNAAELKRVALRTPCVMVGCTGADSVDDDDYPDAMLMQWSAGVVCQGTSQLPRDAEALTIAQLVAVCIVGNPWRSEDVGSVRNVRMRNVYTSDLDETGLACWEITWTQSVNLVTSSDLALGSFKKFVTKWKLDDSTTNVTDYLKLEGAN